MKLLHVIPSMDPAGGGPSEGVRQLNGPLAAFGVRADVCCCDVPDAPFLRNTPYRVFAHGPSTLRYGLNLRMLSWLRQHAEDYDAVIVEGIWQFHSVATWLALRGKPVPYFVYTHGMLDPWFKRRYPLKHLKKMAYWLLGDYWVLRHARAVLFTCAEEMRLARQSFRLYRCREEVSSYGTATPPAARDELAERFLSRFPALRGKRLLLFIGRVHEKKGCDVLMEAFAEVCDRDPSLHLVLAGPCDDAMRASLGKLAAAIGIADRVTWTGMLAGDDKWGSFHAAEAFCLASHQENFGVAVAESLGCGVPVLISNKVNIWREIVEDGAGFAGDDTPSAMADVLDRWLSLDDASRAQMRVAAQACFDRRFQSRAVAERLVRLISAETGLPTVDAPHLSTP
ncbi:glycosyltransferase [Cupriavidus pauculus]|uniref:Transferase n=1 Tax=Cupriavidus pauculus TaxID=82633 RepID=A0A2N5C4C1_9BURK|nr:glycosyltransferase [Cupriavidus pauculus]PLP97064.1 transferase [Cupriavidus pauculus]